MNVATDDPLFWRLFALAQTLPRLPPREMILWLEKVSGQPLTPARLARLSLDHLAREFPSVAGQPTVGLWQLVMSCLAGELPEHLTTHPERAEPLQLRAAFASSDGLMIDGHFGQGKLFFIYAFDDKGPYLQQVRRHRDEPDAPEEGNEARARMLSDCHLLFCEAIGGPAAARVIRNNIHPIKIKPPMTIEQQLQALRTMLAGRIPPWLAKRLGKTHPLSQHQFSL
ncbi:NifB/NifX family molybdenum-iron cluster-binding protein [Acerihabitans arboris]|uniref:Nitrogen fixation protein NifY n=1 Tax=Acerihabitans arboris TaxID=2691583 RepID=A0A845SI37_9GAMM|nr:NifB/NifX family molybdenum-iron cluster-binding protein [Acerihabitans arboris]NDL62947.1 nitrogen fixation protein NifY [Acerihabitans arboris]